MKILSIIGIAFFSLACLGTLTNLLTNGQWLDFITGAPLSIGLLALSIKGYKKYTQKEVKKEKAQKDTNQSKNQFSAKRVGIVVGCVIFVSILTLFLVGLYEESKDSNTSQGGYSSTTDILGKITWKITGKSISTPNYEIKIDDVSSKFIKEQYTQKIKNSITKKPENIYIQPYNQVSLKLTVTNKSSQPLDVGSLVGNLVLRDVLPEDDEYLTKGLPNYGGKRLTQDVLVGKASKEYTVAFDQDCSSSKSYYLYADGELGYIVFTIENSTVLPLAKNPPSIKFKKIGIKYYAEITQSNKELFKTDSLYKDLVVRATNGVTLKDIHYNSEKIKSDYKNKYDSYDALGIVIEAEKGGKPYFGRLEYIYLEPKDSLILYLGIDESDLTGGYSKIDLLYNGQSVDSASLY